MAKETQANVGLVHGDSNSPVSSVPPRLRPQGLPLGLWAPAHTSVGISAGLPPFAVEAAVAIPG